MSKPQIFTLMGPTAVGKTETAMTLAQHHGFELISVDSVLVYRGMDVGSAKPSADEQARAPHALIDIREFWQTYSAGDFKLDCDAEIRRILANGNKPLLVGGSQLYFKTLWNLNSDLPGPNDQVRTRIRRQAQEDGWPAMHRKLAEVDPQAAARLHPNHNTRIERALEVFELTGRPLSSFHVTQQTDYDIHSMAIIPEDRAWLHARIERRLWTMIDMGFEAELDALMNHPEFDIALPSMSSVGYRQAIEGRTNQQSLQQWMPKAIAATRQLAKRQLTWLRSWPDLTVLRAESLRPDDALRALAHLI